MKISINPLEKSFATLVKALERSFKEPDDLEVRDACIQRFEYTYELCIKLIKRYIEQETPTFDNIDQMNYRDLLRVGVEVGLIEHLEKWFLYREARNQTSHAYDENKAQRVYDLLPDFVQQAEYLINQFHQRLKVINDPFKTT